MAFWPHGIVGKVLYKEGIIFKLETISKLENLWNIVATFVKEKSLEESFKENLAIFYIYMYIHTHIHQGNNNKAWKKDIFY